MAKQTKIVVYKPSADPDSPDWTTAYASRIDLVAPGRQLAQVLRQRGSPKTLFVDCGPSKESPTKVRLLWENGYEVVAPRIKKPASSGLGPVSRVVAAFAFLVVFCAFAIEFTQTIATLADAMQ